MSLLFETSTSLEAHKMLLNAKNDVNEYLCGLDENERKNILKHIGVRDYTRSGMCYAPTSINGSE